MPLCETVASAIHMLSPDRGYVRDDREEVADRLRDSNYFNGIRGTGTPRRVMSLHDALAQILVADERHEVIAVGSSLTEERLTLYVARDGRDSRGTDISTTKQQLESVWRSLKDIRSSVPPSFRMSPDPVGVGNDRHSQMHEEFRYSAYQYQRQKLVKRFSKMENMGFKTFFEQVLSPNSKFVGSRRTWQGDSAVIYQDEEELVVCLAGVYRLILRYLESRAEDDLRKIVHAMIMAVDAFKEKSAKVHEDILARRGGENFFTRCNVILNQTRPEGPLKKPEAFRRFWQKAFSLEHAVEDLLRLPYSKRLGHFLDRDFEVVAVPAQRNVLEYNLKEDTEFHKLFQTPEDCEDFLERKKSSLQCHIEVSTHCECTLLAYLVRHNIDALGYIGFSKLSCAPCSWYFAWYNDNVASFGKSFHTRGSHGKRYHGWTYARISPDIDNAIEAFLLRKAHAELLSTLRRQRCDSDSTNASGPSVRLVDGPLQETHFAHDRKSTMFSVYEDGDLRLPRTRG